MMFFFKKREIVLECFTDKAELIVDAPINKAYAYIPEWWKALPKPHMKPGNMFASKNMKHCPGIIELYKNSLVIPLWSDLKIIMGDNNSEPYQYAWQFSDGRSKIEEHPVSDRGDYLPNKHYQHLKLVTPWVLKTNRYVKWAWFGATWNSDAPQDIVVPPGIDEYYYQHSATINMFIPRNNVVREFVIPFRTPLVFIAPMSEDKINIKHILVTTEELNKIQAFGCYSPKFFNSYYYTRKLRNK